MALISFPCRYRPNSNCNSKSTSPVSFGRLEILRQPQLFPHSHRYAPTLCPELLPPITSCSVGQYTRRTGAGLWQFPRRAQPNSRRPPTRRRRQFQIPRNRNWHWKSDRNDDGRRAIERIGWPRDRGGRVEPLNLLFDMVVCPGSAELSKMDGQ